MGIFQSSTEKLKQHLENDVLTIIYPSPYSERIQIAGKSPIKPALHNAQLFQLHAQPIEGYIECLVNVNDGRNQVQDPSKFPYSVHGVIATKFKGVDGITWGTGTLIGPNVVLTAGHNLYRHDVKGYAELESMQFLPGMNGQIPPFGIISVEQYFISPSYLREKKEDYGILILKEPIGERTGYFGLMCPKPEEIKGKMINVTGYPGDKVKTKPKTYEMWGMESSAFHIDDTQKFINYSIDTGVGQSGSGVWFQEGEEYYVCGIHVNGYPIFGQGTLLTKKIYEQIYAWLKQASLKEHLLKVGETKRLEFRDYKINLSSISLLTKYNLEGLTMLNLSGHPIKTKGIKVLLENSSLKSLSRLNLSQTQIDAAGAEIIGKNTSWTNLVRLDLSSNNIGTKGAVAIAKNTSWVNLSKLYLNRNFIGVEGAIALAANESLRNLAHLSLSQNKIGTEGAVALGNNNFWTRLSHLELRSNYIGAGAAVVLANNITWTNLLYLDLSSNNLGTEGVVSLAKNASWINLSHLDLSSNHIGPKGGKALGKNTSWEKLTYLNLGWNKIHEGVICLAKNTSWVNLTYLNLSFSQISPKGVEVLAQNASWSKLSTLHLFSCGVVDVKALLANPHWKCLKKEGINTLKFPL